MSKIIGISGKIKSGKDALADFLIKALSKYNYKKVSFAYKVKEIVVYFVI